jgi:hypothetical protein
MPPPGNESRWRAWRHFCPESRQSQADQKIQQCQHLSQTAAYHAHCPESFGRWLIRGNAPNASILAQTRETVS